MDVQDRRVRRTEQMLTNALIELTLEKGYEAITIRDITEKADIGYATFFRHYRDKDALLQDVVDVVLEELLRLLLPGGPDTDPETVGTLLFTYVQDHPEVIRVLLGSGGASPLYKQIIVTGTQETLRGHTERPESVVPMEIAAYHVVASSIALIQWWLDHAMPYPPERMGKIYDALIYRPASEVAFGEL